MRLCASSFQGLAVQKKSSAGDGDAFNPSNEPSPVSKGDLHPEHPRRHKRRTPDEFNGIQVNYCKNPRCANFGIPIGKKAAKEALNNSSVRVVCCFQSEFSAKPVVAQPF